MPDANTPVTPTVSDQITALQNELNRISGVLASTSKANTDLQAQVQDLQGKVEAASTQESQTLQALSSLLAAAKAVQ